jgi:hypothetical protein
MAREYNAAGNVNPDSLTTTGELHDKISPDDTLVFPESLSAAADGSLYIGSWKGIVYRALPGQTKATPWIMALLGEWPAVDPGRAGGR